MRLPLERQLWLSLVILSGIVSAVQSVCPSGCDCDDESLEVNCVNANLDFVPITLNPLVQKLLLKNNRIRSVESGFSFYHELHFIDLSHNHLLKISQGSFSTQKSLNELYLNNNKITSLSNQTFGRGDRGLLSLIHLNIRVNLLETIEPGIFISTPNLQELDLGENSIREINSSAFRGLENLRILKLDRNELRDVPSVFSNDSHNNGLIPSPMLSHLVELSLGLNPIDMIQRNSFTALRKLGVLDLKGCHLSFIDSDAFNGLFHLKKLLLSDNNLKLIPSRAFLPLRHLEVLKIGRNPISSIEASAFSSLRLLKVMEMSGAPALEVVDAQAFSSNLDLEVVQISSAKKLLNLPPKLFEGISSLKTLILKDNGLTMLPEDLASWQSLRVLRLEGNPFACSCDLLWLRDLLALSTFSNSSFLVLCDEPREVRERRISSLSDSDLNCYVSGPFQKTLLGLTLLVVIILLVVLFFLLYRFHDNIKNACKRNCFRQGRTSGVPKSHRPTSTSVVKAAEMDASTKTSFLSQSSYPYGDEEFALRTSLMSMSPQHTNQGRYSHALNPNTLQRQFHEQNYPTHSLSHPLFHVQQSQGPPYVHGHPNGTLLHYGDAEYETPLNVGVNGNFHYPAAPLNNSVNGNDTLHHLSMQSNNSHQRPIPITEL